MVQFTQLNHVIDTKMSHIVDVVEKIAQKLGVCSSSSSSTPDVELVHAHTPTARGRRRSPAAGSSGSSS